jgi:hypothetical protein
MRIHFVGPLAALAAFPLAALTAAPTTQCVIQSTLHGFVNLRESPSQTAKSVGRLKAHDVVLISSDRPPAGAWTHVTTFKRDGGYGPSGWVLDRWISKDDCG